MRPTGAPARRHGTRVRPVSGLASGVRASNSVSAMQAMKTTTTVITATSGQGR